jgi:hypothetical protein
MPIFLIVTLTLYAGMNSYFFWKVHLAFPGMGWLHYVLAAVLAILVAGPVLSRVLDRSGYPRLGGAIGLATYGWLPIVFWLCCFGIAASAWNIGAGLIAGRAGGGLIAGPRVTLAIMGVLAAGLTALSVAEAGAIRLHAITIRSDKLPKGAKPIRIVQITDMHLPGGLSGS